MATSRNLTAAMSATFTSTGERTFTGSLTLESVATCQVNGKYAKPVTYTLTKDGA